MLLSFGPECKSKLKCSERPNNSSPLPLPLLPSECVKQCVAPRRGSTQLNLTQLSTCCCTNILKNLSRHKSAPGHVNPIFIFTFVRIQTMFRLWCFSLTPLFRRIALSCLQRFQSLLFLFLVFFSRSFFTNAKLFLNEVRHHLHFA